MTEKLQKRITAAGIFFLICVLPMGIPLFLSPNRRTLLNSYCSVPFWLAASIVIGAAGVGILFFAFKGNIDGRIGRLGLVLGALCLAALCVFSLFTKVVNPLRDIPYLNNPVSARLENVHFYYNNIGDSPAIELEGEDSSGVRMVFDIDKDTYENGKALYMQAENMSQEHMVTADIEYLPYSKVITQVDIHTAETNR